jgi:hypothetical protein
LIIAGRVAFYYIGEITAASAVTGKPACNPLSAAKQTFDWRQADIAMLLG